jgi:hypothetical protein
MKIIWYRLFYVWFILGLLMFTIFSCQAAHAAEGYMTYYTVESCMREGTWQKWGGKMANGKPFNNNLRICALPWKPDGKAYLVCGPVGCAEVRHEDRGPGRGPQKRGVVIDTTPVIFKEVCGDLKQGRCEVGYQEIL